MQHTNTPTISRRSARIARATGTHSLPGPPARADGSSDGGRKEVSPLPHSIPLSPTDSILQALTDVHKLLKDSGHNTSSEIELDLVPNTRIDEAHQIGLSGSAHRKGVGSQSFGKHTRDASQQSTVPAGRENACRAMKPASDADGPPESLWCKSPRRRYLCLVAVQIT